jgi:transposase-like protein
MSKKRTCPKCQSTETLRLVSGEYEAAGIKTKEDYDSGRLDFTGCVIGGNDPDFRCKTCGHEWQRELKEGEVRILG